MLFRCNQNTLIINEYYNLFGNLSLKIVIIIIKKKLLYVKKCYKNFRISLQYSRKLTAILKLVLTSIVYLNCITQALLNMFLNEKHL